MAKRDSTAPVLAIEEPGDTAPIDLTEVRRLLSSAPPAPNSERMRCPECLGARLNPQARAVTVTTRHPQFTDRPTRSLPEVCSLPVSDVIDFFTELAMDATRTLIASEVLSPV